MTGELSEEERLLVVIDGLTLDRVLPTPGRCGIASRLTTSQVQEIARRLADANLVIVEIDDDGAPFYGVTPMGGDVLAGIFA